MSQFSDTELMAMLSGALAPTPATPDETTLARLHTTLTELSNESMLNIATRVGRTKRFAGLHSRVARHTSLVAVATLLLTGGVATAGVATNTLPGPTRNFAYDLGLPVTSPGLYQTQINLERLKKSIDHHNHVAEVRWGRLLQQELKNLDVGDLAQIRVPALSLLSEAGLEDAQNPSTTSSTNDNSNTDRNSSVTTSTVPNASDNDSSDANSAGSNTLIPTLTVPNPTILVPTTVANSDGIGESMPTTTSSANSDQSTTEVTLPPVSGDLSGANS